MQASWDTRVPSSEAVGPHWLQGMRASWGRGLPNPACEGPSSGGALSGKARMSPLCHVQSAAAWHASHQDGDRCWLRSSAPSLEGAFVPCGVYPDIFSVCPRNPASLCASHLISQGEDLISLITTQALKQVTSGATSQSRDGQA